MRSNSDQSEGLIAAVASTMRCPIQPLAWPLGEGRGEETRVHLVAIRSVNYVGDAVLREQDYSVASNSAIRHAAAAGLPVPIPFASGSFGQRRWQIEPRMTGQPLSAVDPRSAQQSLPSVADALTKLHDRRTKGILEDGSDLSISRNGLTAHTTKCVERFAAASSTSLGTKIVDAARRTSWNSTISLCHGDLTHRNVMVSHNRLSGVIDWSPQLIMIGPPEIDVAIFRTALLLDAGPIAALADSLIAEFIRANPRLASDRIEAATDWSLLQLLSWIYGRRIGLTGFPGDNLIEGSRPKQVELENRVFELLSRPRS